MPTRRASIAGLCAAAAVLLGACAGVGPSEGVNAPPIESGRGASSAGGRSQVKVGLILPLSAPGNAALTGQSMRNAAELALAEYNSPDVQLLVKDDGGTPQGTQQAVQQALDEGAEVLVGPVFAQSVGVAGQLARQRGVPVIAFSTDANVASRGVYLLSFLPESDVDRIVEHALGTGKRSFAALVPENAYGSVVEAALRQTAARRNGRIVALERYSADPGRDSRVRMLAQSAVSADAILIADGGEAVPRVMQALVAAGVDPRRIQLLGTGLWDDPRIFADPALQGGLYAAPDGAGYRAFAGRYRQKFGQDPVRTASLAYDAMALVAALAKTQGPQRFAEEVLTSPAGFAGIDGVFRLRPEGTNQRGLAVMRVGPGGGQVVAPAPRAFSSSGL